MQIQWLAIIVGGVASFLLSAFAALLIWPVLLILGSETPTNSSIVLGVLIGTLLGGFVAGRQSPRPAFHGALTGLLFVGAVGIVAISSGSPAPVSTISTFFLLGATLGSIGGYVALRRMRARSRRPSTN
jgi:putative membrane protein (TIGR04086 family)